jgi:hypothetical protein
MFDDCTTQDNRKIDIMQAEINDLRLLVRLLKDELDVYKNENARLKEENWRLKDEIAILKKQKPRPKIPPNTLEGPRNNSGQGGENAKIPRGNHPRKSKTTRLVIHQTVRIKPEVLLSGAIFKGIQKFTVQDILFETSNTLYERERWLLPDGTYWNGELPKNIAGHYGPKLMAYILNQHYECRVTEPQLLRSLHSMGVLISAGQLSNLLIESNEGFHAEKEELLPAGIEATGQIQVDDIGARHMGKNGYTTIIGNALFAFFSTDYSKSRLNFLKVLHGGTPFYLLNKDAWSYIDEQAPGSRLRGYLEPHCSLKPMDLTTWVKFMTSKGIDGTEQIRLASEAALFASLIHHGIPRNLKIHADDARQFAVFINSLCWIHEERHYRKFQVYNPETEQAIAGVRGEIWELYNGLKAYKVAPLEAEKLRLTQEFDRIFQQTTISPLLNARLALTHEKKDRLLRVLEYPMTPLHNNSTETDGRSGVVIKKVSAGTRSEAGKKARDTFLSLKQTTRKLGISFLDYLFDRTSRQNRIPRLGSLIRMGGYQTAAP